MEWVDSGIFQIGSSLSNLPADHEAGRTAYSLQRKIFGIRRRNARYVAKIAVGIDITRVSSRHANVSIVWRVEASSAASPNAHLTRDAVSVEQHHMPGTKTFHGYQ